MITLDQYLSQHGKDAAPGELTSELIEDANRTVMKVNQLCSRAGWRPELRSGWRPSAANGRTPGAAPRSKHLVAQAIDIADPDGELDDWCMAHLHELEDVGLWLEHPAATKGWCHLQIVPPKSGNRVFYP